MSKKLFISLPMNGKDELEIIDTRDEIFRSMKTIGDFELLETYYREDAPKDASRLWYLGRSVQDLGLADLVIFAPGWQYYKGCVTEHHICETYGIKWINWEETTKRLIQLMRNCHDDDLDDLK